MQPVKFYNFSNGEYEKSRGLFGPCIWSYFNLIYVHEGALKYFFPMIAEEIVVDEGEFLLIYPDTLYHGICHTDEALATVNRFEVTEEAQNFEPWRTICTQNTQYRHLKNFSFNASELIKSGVLIARETASEMNYAKRCGLLTYLMSDLFTDPQTRPSKKIRRHHQAFTDLIFWMRNNLTRDVPLSEMAAHCEMSAPHFRASFKEFTGWSPKIFFNRLRMQAACTKLAYTKIPVKQIAYEMGFKEVSSFYKAFRHFCPMTPAQFRKNAFNLSFIADKPDFDNA